MDKNPKAINQSEPSPELSTSVIFILSEVKLNVLNEMYK